MSDTAKPISEKTSAATRPFRVLCIDGGGIRGLYSAMVLHTIARGFALKRGVKSLDVGKGFDLIAGTSTGGILGCCLAAGLSTRDTVNLYREVGPKIFLNPMPDTKVFFVKWVVNNLKHAANKSDQLREALTKKLGDMTLESLYEQRKIALCIPCVNMATSKSWVYKTPHSPELVRDRKYKLVDVCLATSAAPIYLPLVAVDDPDDPIHHLVFADGGLWANNPTLISMIEALGLARLNQPIQILSLSTCPPPQGNIISKQQTNWGLFRWRAGTIALNASLEAQAWGYFYTAQKLAQHLSELNRPCSLIRLPHSSAAQDQLKYLGLDRASKEALQILSDLGKQDGDLENQSPQIREGLESIFNDMPVLEENY